MYEPKDIDKNTNLTCGQPSAIDGQCTNHNQNFDVKRAKTLNRELVWP